MDSNYYHYYEIGIPQDSITSLTATYNKVRWGDKFYIDRITVRDDWMTSDIADVSPSHRGFRWRIMDEMTAVAYYDGVVYCRSLNDARVERPKPTPWQKPLYFYDYAKDKKNDPLNGTWEQYTNYNWISMMLTDNDIKAWNTDKEYPYPGDVPVHQASFRDKKDHVIKAGSIRGTFCDFASHTHSLAVDFLNPHFILTESPQVTDSVVTTRRNNYDPYNLVCQRAVHNPLNLVDNKDYKGDSPYFIDTTSDYPYAVDSIFVMPPKRNEVCNIRDAVVDANKEGYRSFMNIKVPYTANQGEARTSFKDGEAAKADTAYCSLNSSNFVIDRKEGNEDQYLHEIFDQEKIGYVHQLKDVVVRCANIQGQTYDGSGESGNLGKQDYRPNGKEEDLTTDNNEIQIGQLYYWPNYYEENVLYYGVYKRHSLVIEVRTGGRNFFTRADNDNPFTAIDEPAAPTREVIATEYYNMAGMRSSEPFNGFNVVVTRYSDGTISSKKLMTTRN